MISEAPPPLPRPKSLRVAWTLNLLWPGAGQIYLGQWMLGGVLMVLFLGCFVGSVAIFLVDYVKYLRLAMDGNILRGNQLEQIGHAFQIRWLWGLLGAGLLIYVGALVQLLAGPTRTSSPGERNRQSGEAPPRI